MKAGGFIAERVLHVDDDAIALCRGDGGDGPLAVDANDGPNVLSVRIRIDPRHVKIVRDGGTLNDSEENGYWKQEVGQGDGHVGRVQP